MSDKNVPKFLQSLLFDKCIAASDILATSDGFYMVYKSLSNILAEKGILDFLDSKGERQACNRFFDDWFLYAVPNENEYTYSLLKLREQEHDAKEGTPADGDTPGVTISFISFECEVLRVCLENPTDVERKKLSSEINRVVAYKGQSHHKALKKYFINPQSEGAYLVAVMYTRYIASYAENGFLIVPECYKAIVKQCKSRKKSEKLTRLPQFIESLNENTCELICDHEKIFIKDKNHLNEYECLAILATHTGNTSLYSFAAEVEYHARFLTPWAKIKIPFFGRSIYDSAVRADMTVGDTEFEGPAPFYRPESDIVKRQYELHQNKGELL